MTEESWIVLGLQAIALIIWGTRLEVRVAALEKQVSHSSKRMHEIDEGGTRGMLVLVERQRAMSDHLDRLEERLDANAKTVERRIDEVFRFLQTLKAAVEKNGNSH